MTEVAPAQRSIDISRLDRAPDLEIVNMTKRSAASLLCEERLLEAEGQEPSTLCWGRMEPEKYAGHSALWVLHAHLWRSADLCFATVMCAADIHTARDAHQCWQRMVGPSTYSLSRS
jgi:hypothetical protein